MNSKSDTSNKRDRRILAIFCVLSIAASCNYVLNYRDTSTRMSNSVPENLLQVSAELKNYDLIIPNYSLEWSAFTSFVDLRIINRKNTFLVDPAESHSLAIAIERRNCPQWKCLSNVPDQNFQILTSKFAILFLGIDSSALIQPGVTDYGFISQVVTQASQLINGPIFNRSLQPISD